MPAYDPELATILDADEKYEERERRVKAALVLESNEMLIWWAAERDEVSLLPFSYSSKSIPLFFTFSFRDGSKYYIKALTFLFSSNIIIFLK